MKKTPLALLLAITIAASFFSCSKDDDDDDDDNTTVNEYYISFDMDGVKTEEKGTQCQLNSGISGSSYTSSGFFDLSRMIILDLTFDKGSIVKADLDSLIGNKIPFYRCDDCKVTAELDYDIDGDDYDTYTDDNVFPGHYLKVTSVTYIKTTTIIDESFDVYQLTGEFECILSNGTDTKTITNGTFKLPFWEVE